MKVGDRVICINDNGHGGHNWKSILKKGREYIVYGILECGCGTCLDVGIQCQYSSPCFGCGHNDNTRIHWSLSKRFKKVQEKKKTIYIPVSIHAEIKETQLN